MSEERRILARSIVDTGFLAQISRVAQPTLFESRFCQQVASWTWEYLAQTGEAPGRAMEEIFLRRRKELRDEDEQELIEEFLLALSKDWDRPASTNLEYGVDEAVSYFKVQSLKQLAKQLEAAAVGGDPTRGEHLLATYRRVEPDVGQGVRLLYDAAAVRRSYDRESQVLFRFQGALGEAIGPVVRGDLLAFGAPMKRGKSWWLQHTGTRGLLDNCKVLVINCEMMEEDVISRFWRGFLGQPEHKCTLDRPTFRRNAGEQWEIQYPKFDYDGVDLGPGAVETTQAWLRQIAPGGDIRVEIFPNGGRTVADIEILLDNLERFEDWVPDVIVLDYADLLAAENGRLEGRFALDSVWKRLRGLAQSKHLAIITATQTDRGTLEKDARAGNVAEHIGKVAHVTKLIMLNQSEDERDAGIMRVSCPIRREGKTKFSSVVVLESRELGRAYLDSRWMDDVDSPVLERDSQNRKKGRKGNRD